MHGRVRPQPMHARSNQAMHVPCAVPPQVLLIDLGSANGTLVNQTRIDGRKALLGGEYIQAGDCLFRYCE